MHISGKETILPLLLLAHPCQSDFRGRGCRKQGSKATVADCAHSFQRTLVPNRGA